MRRRIGPVPGRRRNGSLSWNAISVCRESEEKRNSPHQSLVDEVRSEENLESTFGIFKEDPHGPFFLGFRVTLRFRGVDERIWIASVSPVRDWGVCSHFLLVIVVVVSIGTVWDILVKSWEWTGQ